MTINHEYTFLALHEAKARDFEREAEQDRLVREARAARRAAREAAHGELTTRTPWWRRLLGVENRRVRPTGARLAASRGTMTA